jgi:hypothetical protein
VVTNFSRKYNEIANVAYLSYFPFIQGCYAHPDAAPMYVCNLRRPPEIGLLIVGESKDAAPMCQPLQHLVHVTTATGFAVQRDTRTM